MASLQARAREFFEEHASPERKRLLKENLAKLPPGAPPSQAVYAQTPMRFYDATFDAAPLFTDAQPKVEVLMHISWGPRCEAGM